MAVYTTRRFKAVRAGLCVSRAFVCFTRVVCISFLFLLGVRLRLRLVIVALIGLFVLICVTTADSKCPKTSPCNSDSYHYEKKPIQIY